MIRPQPPSARIMRRKMVSVTPAMGASTVAGEMTTSRMLNVDGEAIFLRCSVTLRRVSVAAARHRFEYYSKLASSAGVDEAWGAASGLAADSSDGRRV